ncbi:predicted protein [Naegleria gruberi]|uniref:glutathione transferase n=1 Tax=Naegleria gruberi TaxID=5762 RepID=D2V159_NAEGR|nr:uncharacterized protein NAEGRDRAFT_30189 [Naegleria gruberi]EFC49408.1 predicted protein [Naegleria gruberi]|eukprot:XP_002682152.1 predicted protein [Naegleria gruberi strain NEG-M]
MVYKIYGAAQSTCVQRVLTTIKEKGLEYELVPVDLMKGEHKSPSYLEKHPFGVIPVLEDDGFLIYESRAICRYLEAKHKSQGTELIPTELKALGLFEQGASIETAYFDSNASGLVFEKLFKGMMGYGAADEARVKQLSEKLALNLDAYEKVLAKQEFIGGNQFTLADLYHLPYGNLLFAIGLGNLLLDRPLVKAWWEKISSRPSWKAVSGQQ